MDTRQIDNFLTLNTCRNAHRAADLLFITQQGLSRSIQSLDKELQMTLFERSHAGMEQTPVADYLYGRFQALRTDLDDIRKGVQAVASGKVALAVVPDFIAEMNQTHALVPAPFADPDFK